MSDDPRWSGPTGRVEAYDQVVLEALIRVPGLLDDLDRDHAGPDGPCPACPGRVDDGAPAPRCLVRSAVDHALRIRARREKEEDDTR